MEGEEELGVSRVNDWNEVPDELPDHPPSVAESKYVRLFALDVGGQQGHDQYVYLVPNGLAIVGLAPSHILLHAHKHRGGCQSPRKAEHASLADDGQHEVSAATQEGLDLGRAGGPSSAHGQGQQQSGSQLDGSPSSSERGAAVLGEVQLLQAEEKGSSLVQQPLKSDKNGPASCCSQQQQLPPCPLAEASTSQQSQDRQQCEEVRQRKRHKSNSHPTTTLPFLPNQLVAVNFDIGKRNAFQRQSGKKKAQGNILDTNSVLCRLEGGNGTHIPVRAVAPGKLLEVNQRLQQTPGLVLNRPLREGYIAILFPSEAQRTALLKTLCSVEEYMHLKGLTSKDLSQ